MKSIFFVFVLIILFNLNGIGQITGGGGGDRSRTKIERESKNVVMYSAIIPWEIIGVKYAHLSPLGGYISINSDFLYLQDETHTFVGGIVHQVNHSFNLYGGVGIELNYFDFVSELGFIIDMGSFALDFGFGYNLTYPEGSYGRFGLGYSF